MIPFMPNKRPQQLKLLAFLSVTFSTVATFGCLGAFPSLLAYIRMMDSEIRSELSFCKARSRDLWTQAAAATLRHPAIANNTAGMFSSVYIQSEEVLGGGLDMRFFRVKRQQPPEGLLFECCTCHRGGPGEPGTPGRDGQEGVPGAMGEPGLNGQNAAEAIPEKLPDPCPCEADVGPEGSPGPKGEKGRGGIDGPNGQDGRKGPEGPPGLRGPPGLAGTPGKKGQNGQEGKLQIERGQIGTPGSKGEPGPSGPKGNDGRPGDPGKDGQPGKGGSNGQNGTDGMPGTPGERGDDGEDGAYGSCVHCPPARLSPGY